MNYSSPLNIHTADKPTRPSIRCDGDADVLLAMRRHVEKGIRDGLHQAHLEAIEYLEVLDADLVMEALRKQFSPENVHDLFVDGFHAARETLRKVSGNDYPEPPAEKED